MLLLSMIFMHILDDYYLQGILKELKQKAWWKANYPQEIYKYDYIVALITHAFSWTFCIMLPVAFKLSFNINLQFYIIFIVQLLIHAAVDNFKANKLKINPLTDQTIHLLQIISVFIVYK